jgi:hypothetical protein
VPGETEPFDPIALLQALYRRNVDFVIIGGVAGESYGSAYPTYDLDIAYSRDPSNLARLADALTDLEATLRGAPPDLPFVLDAWTLEHGANFTFSTSHGALDILAEPAGAPPYEALKAGSTVIHIDDVAARVASLDHLIAMKDAAGRTKDKLMAAEYRELSDRLRTDRS